MKKCIGILLVLCMLIGMLPISVMAATDETNFEAFKVTVTAVGSDGLGHKRIVVAGTDFPFAVTTENQLAGCLLNGTVSYTGEDYSATIPFVNVPVYAQPLRGDGRVSLDFTMPSGYTLKEGDITGYTYELTLSPVANETNFAPFKVNVTRTGTPGGAVKRLIAKNNFGFTPAENQLMGCVLNGTATYTGNGSYSAVVPFVNVPLSASLDRGDGTLNLDFVIPTGYSICPDGTQDSFYTWDLTVSPAPKAVDETNFEPFSIAVSAVGSDGAGHKRFVIANDFPFSVTTENQLKGCLLNGTVTYTDEESYSASILFSNVEVYAQPLRGDGRISLDFTLPEGYTMKEGDLTGYTFNLVISPKIQKEEIMLGEGTHLYLPYTAFASDMGTFRLDGNNPYLFGQANSVDARYPATAIIEVPTDGTYYVWGYAKDYTDNAQGSRHAKISVDGKNLANRIGQHGTVENTGSAGSFGWTLAGNVTLTKGRHTIGVVDSSNNYARVKGVLLTTDAEFAGFPQETVGNAESYPATVVKDFIDLSTVSTYGNKVNYTLKNRTDNALASAVVLTALYDTEGSLVAKNVESFTNLAANTSAAPSALVLSPTSAWATGKIMVWESFPSMRPLIEATDIVFTEEDYANPDEGADDDYGTVSSYMLDYTFQNEVYADEFNNRGGMSNTLSKLQCGEDITIAYLGGSITQQESWRPYTTKWFEDTYQGKVTEVNIGLSGTAADLAVCRIDQDILVHNPDLVFIEYAVNGGAAKDMEGMVRKIWEHDPTTDICFVYTAMTSEYSTYKSGTLPNNATVFEAVASYYDIPCVFFAKQAFDLYEQDKLTLVAASADADKILYSTDGIHPTADSGYLAAGAIARSVVNMEKTFDAESYTIIDHTLPQNLYDTTAWVHANYSDDWSKMQFGGSWLDCSLDDSNNFQNYSYTGGYLSTFKQLFPNMTGTTVAGSSVTVKFKGTDIGIFEAGGQYSGQLRVIVDGIEHTDKLVLYNAAYDSKLRHQYCFLNTLPYGEHTVTFILDSEIPDKSALQSQNPSDTTYQKNEFYLGKILLNGELMDIHAE